MPIFGHSRENVHIFYQSVTKCTYFDAVRQTVPQMLHLLVGSRVGEEETVLVSYTETSYNPTSTYSCVDNLQELEVKGLGFIRSQSS